MVLRFRYVAEDGDEPEEIYVKVDSESVDSASIEDAIMSYIDSVYPHWFSHEKLIRDVLDSFGYTYEIIKPDATFLI